MNIMTFFYIENQNFIINHKLRVLDEHKKVIYVINVFPSHMFITLPQGTKLISTNQKNFLFEREIEFISSQKKFASLKEIFQGKHSLYYLTHLKWLISGSVQKNNFNIKFLGNTIAAFKKRTGKFYQLKVNKKDDIALVALIITIIDNPRMNPISTAEIRSDKKKRQLCWEFFNTK